MRLGTLAVSNVSTQPRRISFAAIQSVSVIRSQPVSLPAFAASAILATNSSLPSTTSW